VFVSTAAEFLQQGVLAQEGQADVNVGRGARHNESALRPLSAQLPNAPRAPPVHDVCSNLTHPLQHV